MRILMVCPEFPPTIGGMQSDALGFARYLQRHGLDLLVLTRTCLELRVSWNEAASWDEKSGIPTVRCLEIQRSLWSSVLPILRHIRYFQPDVIYFTNVGIASCAALLPVPAVSRTVGNDYIRPWIGPRKAGLKAPKVILKMLGMRPLVRRVAHRRMIGSYTRNAELGLRACRLYIANSDYTRNGLLERGVPRDRIRVIRGGVDDMFFAAKPEERRRVRQQLGIGEKQPAFITACRLVQKKGIDDALRAFGRVRDRFQDGVFVIVGDGPELRSLQELSAKLGLEASVRFLGRRPLPEVASYLTSADVFLMPSKPTSPLPTADVETMGRSACEAAACCLPVVGTRTGGLPEVVLDGVTGLIVEPGNVDALAEAMLKLLKEPELRHVLGHQAGQFARNNFSWASVGKKTAAALTAAVDLGPMQDKDDMVREFEGLSGPAPQIEGEVIELSEDDEVPEVALTCPPAFHCRVWLSRPTGSNLAQRLERFQRCRSISIAIDPVVELGIKRPAEMASRSAEVPLADPSFWKLLKACFLARAQVRGQGEVLLHTSGFARSFADFLNVLR